MSWQLNLGGHVGSLEEERAIIDKVAQFVESLGEGIWHTMSSQFHGTGTTDVLVHNAESGTEADPNATAPPAPDAPSTEVPPAPEPVPADSTPVTDPATDPATGTPDAPA